MRNLAVSARVAEPVRPTVADVATRVVAYFPSGFNALDASNEDGKRLSSWNTRAC